MRTILSALKIFTGVFNGNYILDNNQNIVVINIRKYLLGKQYRRGVCSIIVHF